MRFQLGALVLALSAAASCGGDDDCPAGSARSGDDCIPIVSDAGGDGGQDMAMSDDLGVDEGTPDAGPCGMPCTAPTLLCNATSGECVQCTAADTTACSGATPVCDTTAGECVACNVSSDCASLTAPQCNAATHVCEACTADAACMGRATTTACDVTGGGDCVACTAGNETPCGANSCNPATNSCTTTARGTIGNCSTCVADSECVADHRCVSTDFAAASTGLRCLPLRAGPGCARPFAERRDGVVSASGATVDVCDLATTSCAAFLHFRTAQAACTGFGVPASASDGECGAPAVADGLCRLSGVGNRCTYGCASDDDCIEPFTCLTGMPPRYCSL